MYMIKDKTTLKNRTINLSDKREILKYNQLQYDKITHHNLNDIFMVSLICCKCKNEIGLMSIIGIKYRLKDDILICPDCGYKMRLKEDL